MKKILVVVTSHGRLGSTPEQTGLWLEEFAACYHRFIGSGFAVTVASPAGGGVPIDPRSLEGGFPDRESRKFMASRDPVLDDTAKLSEVNPGAFSALFYPGGHGPMWDLARDRRNARIVSDFFARDKPVGALCHGAAALLKARKRNGYPAVFGRRLTAFSNREELDIGYDGLLPFMLEDKLRSLGACFTAKERWRPHVVVDGNLVTGQNPDSAPAAAEAIVELAACGERFMPPCPRHVWRFRSGSVSGG